MTAAPTKPVASIRWLAAPSSSLWLEQAISRPEEVLIDHAHCERKAAGAALQLMFRYPSSESLAEALSPLAARGAGAFRSGSRLAATSRDCALRPLPAPAYGSRLAGEIRRQEPLRQLDSFLVAGLIEARSHERMALLAEHSPDPELRELYGDLLASEARHFGLYWLLCEQHWPREVIIPRLEALAAVEVEALSGELARPEDVRMHSVGVQPSSKG